ncbi:MAG: hypothetical protein ACO1OC_05960 [Tuberibacillus sp.]
MRKWILRAAAAAVVFFCFANVVAANDIEKIKISLSENEAAISFLNLPNGEATLIQGQDKSVLINTGSEDSYIDLKNQLDKMAVQHIDTVILTNSEPSFSGNIKEVVQRYDVSKILTSPEIKKEFCAETKSLCYLFDETDHRSHFLMPHLKMKVMEESPCGEQNILFTYGHTKLYYMGFADERSQKKLFKKHPFRVSIIKVSHYGRGYQIHPKLLKWFDPEMAVLFHKNNIEPNKDFLNDLATEWVETYHLEYIGTLTVHLTPESYELAPFFND